MLNCWKIPVLHEVVPFWAVVTGKTVAIVTDCGILNIGTSILKYYKIFWFVLKQNSFYQFRILPKSHPYPRTVNVTI